METIYDFIIGEGVSYSRPIQIEDGWDWNMKEHIRRSFLYKNSQFEQENDNRDLRPFKNIIRTVLNTQYRTEGFDVKDIELYVDNPDLYYKSFLIRKFHDKWAVENEMDTFIDETVESYADYGGVLVRHTDKRPEVVDMGAIAFCSQRDLLAHPFGIKHEMSPTELRAMKKWGQEGTSTIDIESFITLTKDEEKIEVYEVHGDMPEAWLEEEDNESEEDTMQVQVVAFYHDSDEKEQGVTLFRHRQPKLPFKFLKRDPIHGRALGFGGIEELFEAQVWTNWSEVKLTEMMDQASKTIYKSTDHSFKTRNNLANAEMGEVMALQEGKDISQLDTFPRNSQVFDSSLIKWEEHAGRMGFVSEGLLGQPPSSGTPFKSLEAQITESKGMHRYRQGKIAVFMDEIYRDWVLPRMMKEVVKGQRFLMNLSADEMMEIGKQVAESVTANEVKEKILEGELITNEEIEVFRQTSQERFAESPKKFIEILKDEFKDMEIGISTNIAGKQKDLGLLTDKIVNVLRQFLATPELRQDPEMVKLLNVILESSGMSPMLFGAKAPPQLQQPQGGGGGTEPLKALGEAQQQPVA